MSSFPHQLPIDDAALGSSAAASAGQAQAAVDTALTAVRAELAAYLEEPAASGVEARFRRALQVCADTVAGLTDTTLAGAIGAEVREVMRAVAKSGVHDAPVPAAELSRARELARRGAGGLLGAMLLVPAWQWPDAPSLSQIPAALAGDYVAWFLAPPQGFVSPGQAENYPVRYLARLEDLLQFARQPSGTPGIREALLAFINHGYCIPLYFCTGSLRRVYEVRAQLLRCAVARPSIELPASSRAGRRLRVGIINRHFGSQTETYTTLPTFEQLDPERFEVLLFAVHEDHSPLESYARSHAAGFTLLPENAGEQVDVLRAARLDVAVFGTNVTAIFQQITRLALHRVAPLQVVNNSSCTTTGMPDIDLYVSGTLTEAPDAPAHFSERLGLVPGPAHAFNYEADRQEPSGTWTRAMLGLPEDAVVFVTAANYFKIIPEMQHAWAKLLAAVPGSRLLVHPFNPNWSSTYPIKRFTAEFDRVLAAHGVATDRLVVSTLKFPSRTDVKELLRVGDLYLDTFPFGGVNSLVDPLELGLPSIVWEGGQFRARMGGALLRSLGLDELVATDEASYLALAVRLATDRAAREALKARIADAMSRAPVFLDPLAASDAFGALLETAYDELAADGREAFRARRTPLQVASPADPLARLQEGAAKLEAGDVTGAAACARAVLGALPTHPAARHLCGAVLLREGRAVRAVDYFLGAVQHVDGDAPLWQDLAIALHESGRPTQALQALETSLRIDSLRIDGWLLLAEMARLAGNEELAAEATGMVRQLTPAESSDRAQDFAPPLADANAAEAKHILLYTDDPQHGGVAQYNHAILLALVAAGHRVSCVQTAADSPMIAEQRQAGVRHLWLDYDTGCDFARTVTDGSHAEMIFRSERPDLVVFSDCCPLSNLAARETARRLGLPYLVVVGFVGSYLAKNFAAQLPLLASHYRAARAVVAVSQENLELLHRQFGLPADAGQVIHYGRPERFFAPRDEAVRARLRAELGLRADAIVCFTAARLAAVKNFSAQLDAARGLAGLPGGDRVHFVWAGDGDQRPALEAAIASFGLGDRVHLLGQRWDVADWYDAADIFVLPSDLEGMPLAIMEAMAKGLPVIATAVSGIPEELGDTGCLLAPAGSNRAAFVAQLARTIHRWAGDAALRIRLGDAARARAEAMFRERLMVERTLGLLNDALVAPAPLSLPV